MANPQPVFASDFFLELNIAGGFTDFNFQDLAQVQGYNPNAGGNNARCVGVMLVGSIGATAAVNFKLAQGGVKTITLTALVPEPVNATGIQNAGSGVTATGVTGVTVSNTTTATGIVLRVYF
jgi:hypothetical protein